MDITVTQLSNGIVVSGVFAPVEIGKPISNAPLLLDADPNLCGFTDIQFGDVFICLRTRGHVGPHDDFDLLVED